MMMKMKYLVVGIGVCAGTIFAAENNSRMITFNNKSGHNLEAFYSNPKGIQSYIPFRNGRSDNQTIAQNQQKIVVTWEKQNVQHKFSLKDIDPTIVVLPAVALRFTHQQRPLYTTFLTSELSSTHTHELVPVIQSPAIRLSSAPQSESSSSSSEDDDNVPPQSMVLLQSESSYSESSEE
jgi:hypothetical protein